MAKRSKIYVSYKAEDSYSFWQDGICFKKLDPPPKVNSILEVSDKIKLASLSSHYDYLTVVSQEKEIDLHMLYLISLKEQRIELLKSFSSPITVMYFLLDSEDTLIIGSELNLFFINIKNKNIMTLEGHHNPPTNVSYRRGSNLLVTWNTFEVLLWSWPQKFLNKRLNLEHSNFVIEAGHVWESQIVFAAFNTGILLLWDQNQNMKEFIIELPQGISMEFGAFSLSSDGEWLIGVGSQAIIVIYSMTNRRVSQVVHFSHIDSSLGIKCVKFLPCIHPQYPKTFLIQTSKSIIIADFVNSSVIKVLNSHRYVICNVSISGDGFILCITYGNGTSKLYTLLSFFPPPSQKLKMENKNLKEVKFSVMKVNDDEGEKKNDVDSLFDETKWKEILEEFEEFPKNYRKHIWVSLMKLPRNYSVLNDILIKEKTFKYENLERYFPGAETALLEALRNVLECLCCWCPPLSRVEFLPVFVFPFLNVFDSNILLCFEASIFIISNWFRFWFEKWPTSSHTLVSLVESLLRDNDVELLNHLNNLGISSTKVVHLILSTAFRQVLTYEEWMVLWDHIISKPQSFMICVCASFICCLRQAILKCSQKAHALQLFHQETWIPIRTIIRKANSFKPPLNWTQLFSKEKVYLQKGVLIPYDFSCSDEEILKLANLNLNKCDEATLPTYQCFDQSSDRNIERKKFTEVDRAQLKAKENSCLQRIQETRRKLLKKN